MSAVPQAQNTRQFKILVVEDSPADRAFYVHLLNQSPFGFDISESESVCEGLQTAREKALDCIILDYNLPDNNGLHFIHSYKEENITEKAAIIMVTGCGNEETAVEAMKLGVLDYLSKRNITETVLVQSVLHAIEKSELKRQLRQYQKDLERSNRELSDFTHTVSHDIKAPLRRIISYCDILQQDIGEKFSPKAAQYMERVVVNSRRLHKLVEDLLNFSEVAHSKEERDSIDLRNLLNEILEDLSPLIKSSKAHITVGNLPIISGYPFRMRQLFQNLLSNAIKYRSQENPVISIQCEDQSSCYLFLVHDNGMGIDKKFHDKIFNDFERLHTQDKIEGSGLGLAICKKALEMHKGKIWVESQLGKGSTFFFTIQKS